MTIKLKSFTYQATLLLY